MEGMLSVNEAGDRYDKVRATTIGKVNQYARNFSEIADIVHPEQAGKSEGMWQFVQSLKHLAQKNVVKTQIKAGLAAKFLDQDPEPVDPRNPLPKKQKINKLVSLFQRASTDETSKIQGKADEIIQRIEYYELFKHRDIDEDNSSKDP